MDTRVIRYRYRRGAGGAKRRWKGKGLNAIGDLGGRYQLIVPMLLSLLFNYDRHLGEGEGET